MSETISTAADLPRIVQAGDPVLRGVAQPVSPSELETPAFRALVATRPLWGLLLR